VEVLIFGLYMKRTGYLESIQDMPRWGTGQYDYGSYVLAAEGQWRNFSISISIVIFSIFRNFFAGAATD
jgi:hypothetical protein